MPRLSLNIVCDTREQRPLPFPSTYEAGGNRYDIQIIRDTLPTGDYSLLGHGGRPGELFGIVIERKNSWEEIAQNLVGDNRARFHREFMRMSLFGERMVVIEAPRSVVLSGDLRSGMNPYALLSGVDAISQHYSVPVWDCTNRHEAMVRTLDALRRYQERFFRLSNRRNGDSRNDAAPITKSQWADAQRRMNSIERALHLLIADPPEVVAENAEAGALAMAEEARA
jgi:ERCC4-type nuclease